MKEKKRYFTIQELASLADVSTSGLRAWERRHGLFRPERTPAGHRLYTSDDLKLFWYVSHLRGEGWELKRIAALGREELLTQANRHFSSQELASPFGSDSNPDFDSARDAGDGAHEEEKGESTPGRRRPFRCTGAPPSSEKGLPRGNPLARAQIGRRTYELILDALHRNDFDDALGGLEKLYAATENNLEFADTCLELMVHVGEAWHAGHISIAAEHALTSRVKHLLLGMLYLRQAGDHEGSPPAPLALCATLPGEMHELGLMRVAVYLREWGYRVTYVGANTPIAALEEHVRRVSPALVAISVTQSMTPVLLNQNLQKLAMAIAHLVPVAVGGSGAQGASHAHPELRQLVLTENMIEFERLCRRIAQEANAAKPHSTGQVLT